MSQLIKFALTGGLATGLQYIIFALGLYVFGLSAGLSSGIGYAAGSVLSYIVNYTFTFESTAKHGKALTLFYIMVALGWSLNTVIVFVAADVMSVNPWVSQIAATGIVFVFNFWASRKWVFTHEQT